MYLQTHCHRLRTRSRAKLLIPRTLPSYLTGVIFFPGYSAVRFPSQSTSTGGTKDTTRGYLRWTFQSLGRGNERYDSRKAALSQIVILAAKCASSGGSSSNTKNRCGAAGLRPAMSHRLLERGSPMRVRSRRPTRRDGGTPPKFPPSGSRLILSGRGSDSLSERATTLD